MSALRHALVALLCGVAGSAVTAQTVTLTGNFTGTTLDSGWAVGGSNFTPTLTAPSIDTAGNGWLRLTDATTIPTPNTGPGTNQSTYAVNTNSFISKNATITASFNYVSYGGTGADGITFFLADASVPFAVGAYGGSLGYAQKTQAGGGGADINGMNGGYIGLGIDEFGNYANPTEGRIGGLGSRPDAVSVRGPGQGLTGYDYLGGTGTLSTSLDAPGTTRPTSTTFQIIITATNQLTVYMGTNASNLSALYSIDLSGYTRPDTLVMGFTGSTGGSTNIHEVRAVDLSSVVANLWTNAAGDSNWGTNNSWWGDPSGQVPELYADVLLDNTYVSTAQTINVGTNRTIRSLQIDAPFTYTLNNGTLTFDRGGISGPSGIFVSQTRGSATQTINSALALNNDIQVQNNSAGTLNLGGAVSLGNRTVDFNGSGATASTGVVSGTGRIIQSGSGTTTLSGNNTYSGGTTISAGTLNANSNTALGNGTVTLSGGTLGSTNSSTVANTVTLTGSAGLSGLTTSGALTQSGGNYTLRMANATQSGAVNLSNNSTARTLTVQVDSGNSTISGVIANGGGSTGSGLTKTGTGTLVLSGANTYTGATTISAGTVRLGANNVFADASTMNIAGGTLDLAGYSDKVGNLTFSNGASIDFGTASGNNSFVFGNLTPTPTGVLTINNYSGPDSSNFNGAGDYLGSTTAALSSTLLDQIYFSGYGTGSLQNGSLTDAGNSLGNAYRIAPKTISWTNYTWTSNSNQQWGTNSNWQGGTAPPNLANPTDVYVNFGTGTQATVSANTSSTINALRFSSAAIGYTISGNATLTFQNGTGVTFVQQQSANNQVLSPASIVTRNNIVFDVTGAGNLTIGAAITDGNSTFSVTKTGTGGTLILTGNNTYDGGTSIQSGALQAQNTNALGTGTVTVFDGAALNLAGNISPTNALSLTGTGVGGNGALRNVSGNNTVSGTITESAATRIQSDAGLLTLSSNLTGNATATTFAGAGNTTVSGTITTGTGAVTKEGNGTLTLSGGSANTYTGTTTVNAGTLNLSKTANVLAVQGPLVVNAGTVNQTTSGQLLSTGSVTLNGGTYNLEGTGNVTQTLQTLNTASGSIVNLGTSDTLTVSGTGVSTVNGRITGTGALVTAGTGTVFLGGNNTYSGGTTIGSVATAANNNALGTGNVTVSSGGNLQIQGGVTVANAMTLSGPGTNANDGAIENFSGNNTLSGNLTLAAATRIQSSSGTLNLTGNVTGANQTLTLGGGGSLNLSGAITTGTGGLTKDGTGSATLSGGTANTYTGNTTVNAGTLNLSKTSGVVAVAGNLTVAGGTVNQTTSGQLATTSNVAVTDGSYNLSNNVTQTVATLNTSAGTTTSLGANSTLTIGGAGNSTVAGAIAGAGGVTKTGTGTLTYTGTIANTYTGNTTVNAGTLNLSNSANVTAVAGNLTIGGGTVNQTTSGQLATTSAVSLTSGSYNLSNNVTQSVATLNTSAGTTTSLGSSSTLTIDGAGNSTVTGAVTGTGGLVKDGTGTATFSGATANTYTGTTTVNAGTLNLSNNAGVVAVAGNLTVAGGTVNQTTSGQLATTSGVSLTSGSYNLSNNVTQTVATLNTSAGTTTSLGANSTLTIGGSGNSTITGAITGAGGVTKTGTGTLTYTGTIANTYTGNTTVNAGTLNLSNNANITAVAGNLTIGGGTVNQTTSGQLATTSGVSLTSGTYNLSNNVTQTVATLNTNSGTTVSLGTASTLTLAGAGNNTIAGVISGAGGLTQTGTGTTTLSGSNTYTGTTTISSGTLQLGASSRLADTSTLNIAGGTFSLNGFSERVGNLNFSDAGTLDFGTTSTNNSFVFNTFESGATGLLTINNYVGPTNANFGGTGDFVGSTSTLTSAQLGQIYFYGYGSGSFQDTGTLRNDGNGLGVSAYRITPGSYNTWDGQRDSNGNISGDTSWGTNRNWVSDNTPAFSNTTRLAFGTSDTPAARQTADMTVDRTVNSIRFDNVGIAFTLTGTNGNGTETLTLDGTLPSLVQVSATNQTMSMDRISWATSGVIEVSNTGNLNLGNSTTNGALYGSGNITKVGTGSGRLILNADNSNWTGALTVAEGVVEARNANALGSTSAGTTVSGGSLYLGTGNLTLSENLTLSGSGYNNTGALRTLATSGTTTLNGTINLPATATINTDAGGTLALNGQISGAGGLTKSGNGTLTLNAANTYTGATTLSAGTTRLGVANAFQNSSGITLQTSANLDLNGFSQMVTNLQSGGAGNSGGNIEFNGATLTLTSGASSFGGDFGSTAGTIVINAGASLTLTDAFNASNINIVLNGGTLNLGSGLTHTFNNLTVTGAGTSVIDFGTSGSTVAQFNNVNVTGAGNLSVTNWTDLVDYFLAQNSPGAQGTSPTNKIVFSGFSGNATKWLPFYGGPNGQITPVPEPSSYGALLLAFSTGCFFYRRRPRAGRALV